MGSTLRMAGLLIAAGMLSLLVACATPTHRLPSAIAADPALATAHQEGSRYGTLLRLAASMRRAGDPAAAVGLYQQALAQAADRPEAYILLGETLIDLEAYDDAVEFFQRALAGEVDNGAIRRGYGRALLGLPRPALAVVQYRAAIAHDPRDVKAHAGLGVAHDLAGEHQAAQASYRRGLELAPKSVVLRNNLGLSLSLAGEHDAAIAILRGLAEAPAATAQNRQNLALAHGLAGQLAAAARIGGLDLEAHEVSRNNAYFAALAAVDPATRAASVTVRRQAPAADRGDAAAAQRIELFSADGGLVLGDGGLALGPAPGGRWFVAIGRHASEREAEQAWQALLARHRERLAGLRRLASMADGPQPLLVGPLARDADARALCADLGSAAPDCTPVAL